jgi:glycosyltransferase involved in cell wall biosynthesis
MIMDTYPGRVGIQQRVIPAYRAVFFDSLANACEKGLSIFAGKPLSDEAIESADSLISAHLVNAENRYFMDPGSSIFVCWQQGFISWLETWQPDVLIVEANPRYFSTPRAINWMHSNGKKVVGWGLGAPSLNGLLAGYRMWERSRMLRTFDAIIAYSRLGAEQYRQMGFPPERVYVASNSAIPVPLAPTQKKVIAEDEKVSIIFVGRLQARKRLDLLLEACAALPEELQPSLVIIGDGPARKELEKMASRVYPQAQFPGAKHGKELDSYFEESDLFVLPGTGGLAVQQAMAQGLPVIVAQGDGTQDDLVRNENGWLVPPDDLSALTNTLQQALSDKIRLRQMGEKSYHIVAEEINVDAMVRVFVEVLNDIS